MLQTLTKINDRLPIPGEFAVSPIIELSDGFLNLLNNDEQEQLSSFSNKKRKKEYLTSRLMLKRMARTMGLSGDEFFIWKDDLGRPGGRCGTDEFCVSIAHTKTDVFCGITRKGAIGVDLEPLTRTVPEKLKQRILHPNETELFLNVETIRLWTIKEALIKLEGLGLRMNMNEVQVQQGESEFFVEINKDKTAKICSFQLEGNWIAVAYYQKF